MCGKCDCLLKQCISITVFEVLSAANVGRTTGKNNCSQIETCYTIYFSILRRKSQLLSQISGLSKRINLCTILWHPLHVNKRMLSLQCQCVTQDTVMRPGVCRGETKTEVWYLIACSHLASKNQDCEIKHLVKPFL